MAPSQKALTQIPGLGCGIISLFIFTCIRYIYGSPRLLCDIYKIYVHNRQYINMSVKAEMHHKT